MPGTKGRFRRELVQRLAMTDDARIVAQQGHQPGLADRLGVTEDVLAEAAHLARAGFAAIVGPSSAPMDVNVVVPLARALIGCAKTVRMTRIDLVRSMLHAAMQTPIEPTIRGWGKWDPLPGSEAIRTRYESLCEKKFSGATRHCLHVSLSIGLHEALERRARAFGVTRARYVMSWIADLVDGRLASVPIVPISIQQLRDDPSAYVLPVVQGMDP